MARKKKAEAQQTRQQLIEAAIGQFATRGVTNTTLTDIADAAKVTRGAVYWHFTSKTEIFNAIWEQQLPLRDLIRDRLSLSEKDDPLLMLREQFITALQYIAHEPRQCALLQILYHKCEFTSDMVSEYEIRKRIGFNNDFLRATLERCISRNIISSQVNVDLTLIVFHGFFSGIIKNWLMNNDSFNLYQQAPALVDNILATLPVMRVSPREEAYDSVSGKISPCSQSASMVCALTGFPNK
ncbi:MULTISPECIES: acrEF/envCD operon transcriptional regulator [Enterobacter cloacae complex]|uniref:acrEF/envCD operon transcriptional regulator n=1 Tax=Enterobacter cloacae complex TaxID=354276 RepID=UPI000735CBE2|nr:MULTISPECIES: acrEF/envCD operon transcriptional regulator [Enterobacter cloacae complex]EKY1817812.1 acrEF/envCD operon transcriptional regulator [Enterobacter cloacae]KTI70183.1 transcriptional regulator [Enterobacter cloacae subsp. cloacae]MCM7453212.1 acrEF/envCD operon transcriptional regulator [Enterobacter cloacae]MDD7872777.1 acrEF/envCD operon transcriptional regulator [Enterobacter cloacae complex sp. 2022EL-00981]OZU91858.1 acrEF/envCD operon transcriptional regulator [Enterobact